ncbi:MAG: Tapt1-like protein [Amphiamblys sp. WSBS2006]|nr:MAG: Tapt1-like protein [Amphiamblys sp. WSBS2006]
MQKKVSEARQPKNRACWKDKKKETYLLLRTVTKIEHLVFQQCSFLAGHALNSLLLVSSLFLLRKNTEARASLLLVLLLAVNVSALYLLDAKWLYGLIEKQSVLKLHPFTLILQLMDEIHHFLGSDILSVLFNETRAAEIGLFFLFGAFNTVCHSTLFLCMFFSLHASVNAPIETFACFFILSFSVELKNGAFTRHGKESFRKMVSADAAKLLYTVFFVFCSYLRGVERMYAELPLQASLQTTLRHSIAVLCLVVSGLVKYCVVAKFNGGIPEDWLVAVRTETHASFQAAAEFIPVVPVLSFVIFVLAESIFF